MTGASNGELVIFGITGAEPEHQSTLKSSTYNTMEAQGDDL